MVQFMSPVFAPFEHRNEEVTTDRLYLLNDVMLGHGVWYRKQENSVSTFTLYAGCAFSDRHSSWPRCVGKNYNFIRNTSKAITRLEHGYIRPS